ncbi:uncharacterized protein K460DRAFT_350031 [Cucurbitaria berberidis CBS 394.84]|uniref:Uncharacterized protein n=1 Tax=Cucurbitaria berberidis CBS 394.84 TaxID=1168544 RepID=A0A9P4GRS4_9PLEO|nr:uncharacterized protein K460DRAFT_350031 [Cucurbitaria berberidis CBS 394.84]KAF1849896.1 hypothetical protein K460DRAFT_350031 [Cucurbitaria berberidis CBS 394.84]
MEVERPASRAHRHLGPPTKQITPVNAKKSVSVAAIFKQQARKTKQMDTTPQAESSISKLTGGQPLIAKSMSVRSGSSVRNPQKADGRVSKNRSDVHLLAVAFRDTSDDYRRHLYKSTTLKINKTLEALLTSLHESTLQTVPTNDSQQDPNVSPLKLSAPAKYEQMALKLHQPLSPYRLTLWRTNTRGEKERFQSTLETRMVHYEEHIVERTNEVAQLQREWEMVVGEIWKLGVSCLGQGIMESLLFTDQGALGLSSSPSKATEPESTLFVPEQGTSSLPRKTRTSKKHVTFETPGGRDEHKAASISMFPACLYQPSRYHNQPLPVVPPVAEREIKNVEMKVAQLGKAQIDELRKIEKDHQEYWKKKTTQVATALQND